MVAVSVHGDASVTWLSLYDYDGQDFGISQCH
jgi:hypothetical protein